MDKMRCQMMPHTSFHNFTKNITRHRKAKSIHTHISHPMQTWLRSWHLPFSKPAVFNIKCPQDVSTPSVGTNTSDPIGFPLPCTVKAGGKMLLGDVSACKPSGGMRVTETTPGISSSMVPITLIPFTHETKRDGQPTSDPPVWGKCRLHKVLFYHSVGDINCDGDPCADRKQFWCEMKIRASAAKGPLILVLFPHLYLREILCADRHLSHIIIYPIMWKGP